MLATLRTPAAALGASLLAAATAFAIEPTGAPAAGDRALRFASPRHQATVLGPATVELAVTPREGLRAAKLEIRIDGKTIATLTSPPWKAAWDAGESGGAHVVEAVLTLSDGSVERATIRTSPLHVDQVEEVALVNVYAIAKSKEGAYVTDMTVGELRLEENGRPQAIERFSPERKPLRIALVLDTSLSMAKGGKLEAAQEAALEFLKVLAPGDEGVVVGFSDRVRVLQELTSDPAALGSAIRATEASGGTALYDAIWDAANLLAEFDGRRVLVLLSDGRDEATSGLEPGSLHTVDEATDRALRNEVIVFAIGLGNEIADDAKRLADDPQARAYALDFYGRRPLVSILRQITDTTGGRAVFSSGPGRLKRAFEEVASDLRHQYTLAYAPDDRRHDGTWREIRLLSLRPGVTITNRKGYFAPKDRATR